MKGDCDTMLLTGGGIEKLRVSYSKSDGMVTAMKFYKQDGSKTFGTMLSSYEEWDFSRTDRLMGLHGRISKNKITQLGVITYKSSCPSYTWVESYNWVEPTCFIKNSVKVGAQTVTTTSNQNFLES